MKIQPKTELDAIREWRSRYSTEEWPLDGAAAEISDERKKKEARELILAAEMGRPFSSVPKHDVIAYSYSNYYNPPIPNSIESLKLQIGILKAEIDALQGKLSLGNSFQKLEAEKAKNDLNNKIFQHQQMLDNLNKRLNLGQS